MINVDNAKTFANILGIREENVITSSLRLELPCTLEQASGFRDKLAGMFGNALLYSADNTFNFVDSKGKFSHDDRRQIWIVESVSDLVSIRKNLKGIKVWVEAIKLVCGADIVLLKVDYMTFPV